MFIDRHVEKLLCCAQCIDGFFLLRAMSYEAIILNVSLDVNSLYAQLNHLIFLE